MGDRAQQVYVPNTFLPYFLVTKNVCLALGRGNFIRLSSFIKLTYTWACPSIHLLQIMVWLGEGGIIGTC